jgi:hypothetical protein
MGRSPGFRSLPPRDTRCLAEFEPAYSPSRRMPTRGPPVGGQALSRRQPLIPVSHRSQPQMGQPSRMKSAIGCEVFEGLRDVPGLRGSCRSRQARSRSIFSSWLRLRGGHRAQPKVAQAMAGEAALRRVPKAQAVRGLFRPSGSLAMEGISDCESSGRSRGSRGNNLDWSPGAVLSETEGVARVGRRRAARGRASGAPDSEENAERCGRVRRPKRVRVVKARYPSGDSGKPESARYLTA